MPELNRCLRPGRSRMSAGVRAKGTRAEPPGGAGQRCSMQPFLARRLYLVFWIAAGFQVFVGALSYYSTAALVRANGSQEQVQALRRELDATLSLLTDAETGQRGYLLTGDPAYLGPYETARATVAEHLQRLEALTEADPEQQALLAALREAVD